MTVSLLIGMALGEGVAVDGVTHNGGVVGCQGAPGVTVAPSSGGAGTTGTTAV